MSMNFKQNNAIKKSIALFGFGNFYTNNSNVLKNLIYIANKI
jgi:hypothetical protein